MKYLLEIPSEVRAKIKYIASLKGITMNTLILSAVHEYLKKDGDTDEGSVEVSKRV